MSAAITDEPWEWLRISEVADVTLGKTPKKSDYRSTGRHRLLKYRDIQNNVLVLDQTKDGFVLDDPAILRTLRPVELGDVLVGASGHSSESIGRKVAIVEALPPDGPHYFAGELLRVKPISDALDSRWAFYYFRSDRGFKALQDAVSGVHLTNGRAREIQIPMAPSDVQRTISDILDGASLATDSASRHLSAARRAIERLRQAVLAAACSGRLTADWRWGKDSDSAPGLVADLQERHQREESRERRPKTIEASVTELDKSLLPQSWAAPPLRLLCEPGRPITYGILKPGPDIDGGIPYVRVVDFKSGTVVLNKIRRTTPEIAHQYRRSVLRTGDLLFAIRGTYGHVAVTPADLDGANITQDTARLTIDRSLSSDYAAIALRSPLTQSQVNRAAKGVAVQGINLADLRELLLPLPPRLEQDEIVRRVDKLFGLCRSLELRVESARHQVQRSSQAVLAKAFRGDLVPAGTEQERTR